MYTLKLENEKYEIQLSDNMSIFKALRNGEEWRDLTGDKLVLALITKIQEQEIEIENLKMM